MRSRSIYVAILVLGLSAAGPLRAADAPTVHRSPGLHLSFEIPGACVAREELHQPDDPTHQISHAVTVACGGPTLLRIDMWLDTTDAPVSTWVDSRLGPLVKGATEVVSERVSSRRLPAVRIERAATPQTHARRLVALKNEGRVYLLTLERAGEAEPAALLETVLGALTPLDGGRP